MERQIKIGWERGRSIGRLEGYGVSLVLYVLISLIY